MGRGGGARCDLRGAPCAANPCHSLDCIRGRRKVYSLVHLLDIHFHCGSFTIKNAPIDNVFDNVRTHGNGDGTGQDQEGNPRVFLTRCLGQVPSLDIHLDHETRTWYLWNSIEVKSLRLDNSESVRDSLSRSEIQKRSRPQRNVAAYHAHIIAKLCEQGLRVQGFFFLGGVFFATNISM